MGDVVHFRQPRSDEGCATLAPPLADLFAPCGFLHAVNAVHVTGTHLSHAIDEIKHIPVRSQGDVTRHGRILEAFARRHKMGDYGGAALHARAIALDRWASEFDPFGESDINGFYAAGASAPLVETDEGLAFEPAHFAEQIEKWTKIFA